MLLESVALVDGLEMKFVASCELDTTFDIQVLAN